MGDLADRVLAKASNPKSITTFILGGVAVFILSFVGGVALETLPVDDAFYDQATTVLAVALILSVFALVLGTPLAIVAFIRQQHRLAQKERAAQIEAATFVKAPESARDAAQQTLVQIQAYYAINKDQAKSSFQFCVLMVAVGFAFLLGGVYALIKNPDAVATAALTAIGGVVAEFIAASAFMLYRSSLAQTGRYFDQLSRTLDTMLAVELCGEIADPARQAAVREAVILSLVDRHPLPHPSQAGLGPGPSPGEGDGGLGGLRPRTARPTAQPPA